MRFRNWLTNEEAPVAPTTPAPVAAPVVTQQPMRLKTTIKQPNGQPMEVVMNYTPASRTTQQWALSGVIDLGAKNAYKNPYTDVRPMGYYDVIPTQLQQQAAAAEIVELPFDIRGMNVEPNQLEARKLVQKSVEGIPQVATWLRNRQLDPQEIMVRYTDEEDPQTKFPLYHVSFRIKPAGSTRIPNKGQLGQWFAGGSMGGGI